MKSFGVDSRNDLTLGSDGNLLIVADLKATLNVCEHAAKAILGEMVLNKQQGLPYFQAVWNGSPSLRAFEAAFRSRIMKVPGVTGIPEFDIEQTQDILKYVATISTVYGEGQISSPIFSKEQANA